MKDMENQLVYKATWKTWITLSMTALVILQVYVVIFYFSSCNVFFMMHVSTDLKHPVWPIISSSFFCLILEKQENKEKMRYLLGESMGGAVALLLHRKKPDFWDGAVLVAPMCKVSLFINYVFFPLFSQIALLFTKKERLPSFIIVFHSSGSSFVFYLYVDVHSLPTKLDLVLVAF